MGKIEIFTFSGYWKRSNIAIAKLKCLCASNFQPQEPRSSSFSQKKFSKIRQILLKNIAFLLGQCNGKN